MVSALGRYSNRSFSITYSNSRFCALQLYHIRHWLYQMGSDGLFFFFLLGGGQPFPQSIILQQQIYHHHHLHTLVNTTTRRTMILSSPSNPPFLTSIKLFFSFHWHFGSVIIKWLRDLEKEGRERGGRERGNKSGERIKLTLQSRNR